jgi:hypothetical protein
VLEVVIGLVAGLLFVVGVVIMAGPVLPRVLGLARRRGQRAPAGPRRPRAGLGRRSPAPAELHPTTVKALAATARLLAMLKEHGMERHAAALRMAGKRLQTEEVSGIHAMRQVLRHLRGVRLEDESDQRIFQGLVGQLQRALDDRAEQLELLPKN